MNQSVEEMDIDFKSNWQDTRVEFFKSLHGYELKNINEKIGSVDYVADDGDNGKKLLRVIIDQHQHASAADLETTRETLKAVESGPYDEATILASRLTESSKSLIRKEKDIRYISTNRDHYSIVDLSDAIYEKTRELCEDKCGKFPSRTDECKGYRDGEYTCTVRRISDNADFHTEMRWPELLMNDFSKLVNLRSRID